MVNFICHLDKAWGDQAFGQTSFWVVSVRVPLDEININLVDCVKQIAQPNVGESHPINPKSE